MSGELPILLPSSTYLTLEIQGRADYVGDVLLLMFVNHGCNGTFNINHISEYHESSMEYPSDDLMLKASGSGSLSEQERLYLWEQIPADYRNVASTLYLPIRNRLAYRASTSEIDIPSGAELLDNYMTYGGLQGRTFWLNAKSLWEECRGMFGLIEQYQKPANRDEEKDASDTHICAEESVCPNQFRAGEYISATIT